jgi:flagellar biosynthesis protein FlhG
MVDQANELRELVRREADRLQTSAQGQPCFLVVSGGRDGVGTTTVALNLAIEASRSGRRVLLVDADPNRGDTAAICRLEERHTLADVLSARRSVPEAIQPGPAGIWVLPGGWTSSWSGGREEVAPGQFRARLAQPLKTMGKRFDFVVIDAGNGANRATAERWQAADAVLLLTTTDLPAIMDAYATVKHSGAKEMSIPVHCLVNMSPDDASAGDVFGRLERSCWRFLGIRLEGAGYLPDDPSMAELIREGQHVVRAANPSPAAGRLARLVESLIPKKELLSRRAG